MAVLSALALLSGHLGLAADDRGELFHIRHFLFAVDQVTLDDQLVLDDAGQLALVFLQ